MMIDCAGWIPWLPAAAAVICGLCCLKRSIRVLAAPVCIGAILASFVITCMTYFSVFGSHEGPVQEVLPVFTWIRIGDFSANMSYFFDPLTMVMLLVITGIGSLVVIYAAGYMAGDRGYARFFASVGLFIFAMTTLVMADNLVLLYLGWEGVGLCSYLLIGFYYDKPSAVAAAKKAFIVNRIGDLGFALGILLAYHQFHTVQFASTTIDGINYPGILEQCRDLSLSHASISVPVMVIPFLLMLGAFGKSAQLPLYVWLPDAMEGPTPVSALIHAATMVTAGVYMIARLIPLFELSPYALPTVAVVGSLTAMFAASIAMCQYDIKRVFAYSTISQLGYMFMGLGVLSTTGAVFHLFTHAFFKALLFLTAGSVMHSLAGQLDLRHMSGLRRKMPITCWLMFAGCLALAGFPFTAGFFSKDTILADSLQKGLTEHNRLYTLLAVAGLITAFMTAYYTFRLWFRVFMGPTSYDMGHEHHQAPPKAQGNIQIEHHHDVHEVGVLLNAPLMVLAVGALFCGYFCHEWIGDMVQGSSAAISSHTDTAHGDGGHVLLFGMDLHVAMMLISSMVSIAGIATAAYYHWLNRRAADRFGACWPRLVNILANKYYVDQWLDQVIVKPLRLIAYLCFVFDRLIIDGLVLSVGWAPRLLGLAIRPTQRGTIQGYGVGMATGLAVALLVMMAYFR